jgi:FMN hydrolase / 5-amino-6-(5-phospho-D-ribitylamino)uracil phosphatase
MRTEIRAVAFDLDNTLWEIEPVIVRAEQRWMQWLRENCPRIPERWTLEELRISRQELAAREPHRAHDFTYLRIASLARHALECGYDAQIAERAFEIFFAARNELDLYPDVRQGLDRLRARFALATLSNGNADLARIGLSDYFTASLNARGIGAAKPDRKCFEHLVAALALTAEQVLYVGDDPFLDVAAARNAGLRTAWMNRTGIAWPAYVCAADLGVTDCIDLAERLGA